MWRKRDVGTLQRQAMQREGVRDTLSHSGLLKYFQVPLMQIAGLLLETIVSSRNIDVECFIIQGEKLEITHHDV